MPLSPDDRPEEPPVDPGSDRPTERSSDDNRAAAPAGFAGRAVRAGWLLLGLFCVGLGFIGALLPLMPTTIFLILAAGCFARSSVRLERWLLDHPAFGPPLRAWREEGAIPLRAKWAACVGIALGAVLFWIGARPDPVTAVLVILVLCGCALWIVTRPAPRAGD